MTDKTTNSSVENSGLFIACIGRVDSGKTKFIETLCEKNLVSKEHGAITQKLTLYDVKTTDITEHLQHFTKYEQIKEYCNRPIIIADTPGHTHFSYLKELVYKNCDYILLFLDVCNVPDDAFLNIVTSLLETKKRFLLVLTKIDKIEAWTLYTPIFKDNFEKQNNVVKTYFNKFLLNIQETFHKIGYILSRYDLAKSEYEIPYCGLSSITCEGYPDIWLYLLYSAKTIKQEYPYLILDTEINNFEYQIGINNYGILKIGSTINGVNGALKIKKLFLTPYQRPQPVKTVTGFTTFAVIGSVSVNSPTHKKTGAILNSYSRGSVEGLIKVFKDRDWPIQGFTVGQIKKIDIVRATASKPPFNVVVSLAKRTKKINVETVITESVIYDIVTKMEQRISTFQNQKVKEFMSNYTICKIMLLPEFVFKKEAPFVIGAKLIAGYIKTGTVLADAKKNTIGTCLQLHKQNQGYQMISTINQNFAIKLDTTLTLDALLKLDAIYNGGTTNYKDPLFQSYLPYLPEKLLKHIESQSY